VQAGQVAHFPRLCRVALSDVKSDWAGNGTVWPGRHHSYVQYLQTHGVRKNAHGCSAARAAAHAAAATGAGWRAGARPVSVGSRSCPELSPHVRDSVLFSLPLGSRRGRALRSRRHLTRGCATAAPGSTMRRAPVGAHRGESLPHLLGGSERGCARRATRRPSRPIDGLARKLRAELERRALRRRSALPSGSATFEASDTARRKRSLASHPPGQHGPPDPTAISLHRPAAELGFALSSSGGPAWRRSQDPPMRRGRRRERERHTAAHATRGSARNTGQPRASRLVRWRLPRSLPCGCARPCRWS
jgi:hypothetical protein